MTRDLVVLTDQKYLSRRGRDQRWIITVGSCWPTYFLVWGNLDEAFDEVADWCEVNEPGAFCDEECEEAYKEAFDAAMAEGLDEEEAQQRGWDASDVDVSRHGNHGRPMSSGTLNIYYENPTRAEILELKERLK